MRIEDSRESQNVEDRRGSRVGRTGAGIGVGTLLILVVGYFLGVDPSTLLSVADVAQQAAPAGGPAAGGQAVTGTPQDPGGQFVARVLGETEDVWGKKIAELGGRYPAPKLVLFTGEVESACGMASAASGPFYCPGDQQVYIDLAFFNELETQFGAPGDFARAYVIAHEVGHHVQALLGATEEVQKVRERSTPAVASRAQVALELQADCYAGIWAREANTMHQAKGLQPYIEAGDIDEALNAAAAVGDDTIQRKMTGRVVPETFTHGSAKQRSTWFKRGFDSGRIQSCDTFNSPD
jgi:predicted metalloprotease